MAWGGNTGGGGMGGGGMGGGGMGGGQRGLGGFAAARPEGLPFAGIPPELADKVAKVLASERPRPRPNVGFTHRVLDRRPLTMRRMFRPYLALLGLAALVVVVEVATLQSGPVLTQRAIDSGILPGHAGVVVVVGILYFALILLGAL